jgi:hypothetical protein
MLNDGLRLIVSKGQEAKPSSDVISQVHGLVVNFNEFSKGCNTVVLAVTIALLLFSSLRDFDRIDQVVQVPLQKLSIESSRRSFLGKNTESIASGLSENTAFLL